MENLKQLEKIAKIFNTDAIVTPEQIDEVLKAIIQLLANFKKDNESLNTETKQHVDDLFGRVIEHHGSVIADLQNGAESSKTELHQQVDEKLAAALAEAKDLLEEAKSVMPKNGKDADQEKIIEKILGKIQLPEYKETVLDDGEEIVAKINELPIDDDTLKIDVEHIKGLAPHMQKFVRGLIATVRNIAYYDETTLVSEYIHKIKFQGAGVLASLDSEGSLIVTITGTTGSYADVTMTDSGNHTLFTIPNTPAAGTLLIINENTGQAVPTSAYTNTTTSITFTASQQIDNQDGTFTTPTFRARYSY